MALSGSQSNSGSLCHGSNRGSQLIINKLRDILNREKIYPCTFLALFLLTPATRAAIPLARRGVSKSMWLHLIAHKYRDITRCVNRATLIDQIQQARKTLEKLLTLLQSVPVARDRFVSHLYQSRREYRRTCETAGKSGKQIERCVISSFQIAESMGFKGDFRQWEGLLRVGE